MMNGYQQQTTREKVVDIKQEEDKLLLKPLAADKQSPCPASPPSQSSSPSHEFSFTVVSLHNTVTAGKTITPPSSAIDLSPADDIFFHGHLLPLHLLSHLPVSPRCSTNSSDGFNVVPIRDQLLHEPKPDHANKTSPGNNCSRISKSDSNIRSKNNHSQVGNFHHQSQSQSHNNNNIETKGRPKSKSFSLSNLTRWHPNNHNKGSMRSGVRETEDKEKHKTKMRRFDLRHVLKRYVRLVRPLWFFRGRRSDNRPLRSQSYSFSGNLRSRSKEKECLGRRRGEFYSAPASMRTSPTNSGLLVATTGFGSSTSDSSTMEELQAAIQAAIAHCKNSSQSGEENIKC